MAARVTRSVWMYSWSARTAQAFGTDLAHGSSACYAVHGCSRASEPWRRCIPDENPAGCTADRMRRLERARVAKWQTATSTSKGWWVWEKTERACFSLNVVICSNSCAMKGEHVCCCVEKLSQHISTKIFFALCWCSVKTEKGIGSLAQTGRPEAQPDDPIDFYFFLIHWDVWAQHLIIMH